MLRQSALRGVCSSPAEDLQRPMHTAEQPADAEGDHSGGVGLGLDRPAQPLFERRGSVTGGASGVRSRIPCLTVYILRGAGGLVGHSSNLRLRIADDTTDAFFRLAAEAPGGSGDPILIHCNCSCETVLGGNLARGWMFRSRVVRQAAERFRVWPRCFLRHQRIALVLLDTCEGASHGPRITSMANRHSDSYHPRDLAVRRVARLSVTGNEQQPIRRKLNLSQWNHGQKFQMRKMRGSARPSRCTDQ